MSLGDGVDNDKAGGNEVIINLIKQFKLMVHRFVVLE